jgi:hypothetical protein
MRKFAGALIAVMLALIVVSAATLFGIYRATQQAPSFYRRALETAVAETDGGERFEQEALNLHNQARRPGQWEARFSEDEINGWLAAVLPKKFPQAQARGFSDPRVAIDGDIVRIAAQSKQGGVATVLSLAAHVHLTEESNEIAVRISDVRAGSLPVPLARLIDEITRRSVQAGLPLRWTDAAGQPVALVRLPLEPKSASGRQLVLERLELQGRELYVSGRTEELPAAQELAGSADQPEDGVASPDASETRHR